MRNSSDQLFSKTYEDEYFSSFCCYTSALTQNSIQKNLFKSHRKITVVQFFFSEVVGCEVTEERISIIVPFGWIFCKTFQISVFLKQLGTKTSWDFTSALREATVFVQVNFDTDPLGLIQIPDAWMRSNTCRFQYFFFYLGFHSRTFTNHRTAGEGGGHFFNSSLPLPTASQTLKHYRGNYCRQLTSTHN